MTRKDHTLEGLTPQPNESLESFIERGKTISAEKVLAFRPQEGDSLGEYLMRLRVAAGWSPEDVETLLRDLQVNLTRVDIVKLENGYLDLVTEQRLRALAALYGVPQDWVLQTAQYRVADEVAVLPATDNLYATLAMRSTRKQPLNAEARQMLDDMFGEIVAALESVPQTDEPSDPSPTEE